MSSICPPALQKGNQVRIISTARKVDRAFIEAAKMKLGALGLTVTYGKNLFADANQFAGNDAERASDLNAAIRDSDCRAIICARGGYGTVRLLEAMDMDAFQNDPKWIVGYSDVTALHNHIYTHTNIESIHGTMPVDYARVDAESFDSLVTCLFEQNIKYQVAPHPLNVLGSTEGNLVGGNLSVIYSLLGSPTALSGTGQILFLEDLDEYLYHIDRIMMALKRSGLLENIKGLIVGSMNDMNDNAIPFGQDAYEIIRAHTESLNIPLCFGFLSGHESSNLAWIHGKKIRLTINDGQPVSVTYL